MTEKYIRSDLDKIELAFDSERMKYGYVGLYEYCYRLGLALKNKLNNISFYLPSSQKDIFGSNINWIRQKSIHKFLPLNLDLNIWHATHQMTQYMGGNKKLKKVLTIHDLNFLYEKKNSSKIKKYLSIVQKNIDRADHLVAISNYVKKDIQTYLKTDDKPLDVIYNGCHLLDFNGFDAPKYKPSSNFLFAIGTVTPKKNFHTLPCLLQNNDFELIIAGRTDSDYANKIISIAKSYHVENRVKLIGTISNEDKYWYFKNCSAFLFPSIAEGFGIPAIEAMSFGKPTFLSNLTSLPEIGADYAYYFNDFDASHMQQVFESSISDYLNNNRKESIIEHAQKFNWSNCADEYIRVYKSLL